jgi:hypothetical protein
VVMPAPRRRTQLRLEVDGQAEIMIGGERFHLSAPARHVLSRLLDANGLRFQDLHSILKSKMNKEEVKSAVYELIRNGLAAFSVDERYLSAGSDLMTSSQEANESSHDQGDLGSLRRA